MTISLLIVISFLISPQNFMEDAEDKIVKLALESVYENYDPESYRFELTSRWIPGSIRELKPGKIESVEAEGLVQKYTNFSVVYRENNRLKKAEVQLQIKAEQKLPVTIERLFRGSKISAEDLRWKWVHIDLTRDKPISTIEHLIGKTLRRTLNADQFITNDIISSEFVIAAGDNIQMIYAENGLQIILGCESRQAGTEGEEIQIYCKETRKKYTATITGSGETVWVKTH